MQLAMWKNHMQIIHSSDGALIYHNVITRRI